MRNAPADLARNAAANAACIAREIPDDRQDFLREIANFDLISAAAVRLAELELSAAGNDLWERLSWEEVCSSIAKHIAVNGTSYTRARLHALTKIAVPSRKR
jgi:hypothetical protein